jgi:hypothetical protein
MKKWKGGKLYDIDTYDTRRHVINGGDIPKNGDRSFEFVQNIKNLSVVGIEKALEDLIAKEDQN